MKILKRIFVVLALLIAVMVVVSFFLPSKIRIQRNLTINAPAAIVFDQVNTLQNWEAWSPWKKMDPTSAMTYNNIPSGNGASYSWKGEKTGEGTLTISESVPNQKIVTELDFKGQGKSTGGFEFKQAGNGVNVNWYMDMDNGMNPLMKYMSLMMKGMLSDQFDQGLNDIKKIAENTPPTPEPMPEVAPVVDSIPQN